MKVAVVFPNEDSFYRKMGMEIYENFEEMKVVFSECEKLTGLNLADALIYENSEHDWDELSKKIAVMAVGVGYYQVFQKTYGIEPQLFIGQGIGYLTALVCMNVISLRTAIKILNDKKCSEVFVKDPLCDIISISGNGATKLKKEICEEMYLCANRPVNIKEYPFWITKYNLDVLLEIGPNNILVQQIQNEKNEITYGYLDTIVSHNHVLDNFIDKKYNNTIYGIMRILGIIFSTQNLNTTTENYDEILEAYNYAKSIVDKFNFAKIKNEEITITEEEYKNCIKCLKSNFIYKNTPKQEIEKRIKMLESETLLQLKPYFIDLYK